MIHNINSIQNLDDLAILSKFTDEYLVQALANAGQRIGMRGDSIKYSYFTFYDLLENGERDMYDSSDYIGTIKYYYDSDTNKYSVQFSIINNENFISDAKTIKSILSSTNIDNTIHVSTDVSISNVLNNVDTFKKGMIIKDDDYLQCLVNCKLIGSEDNDDNNVDILYIKFNNESKTLDTYVRCFYVNTDISGNNFYTIVKVKNNYDNKTYTLSLQEINSSRISDVTTLDKSKFEYSFKWNSCNTSDSYNITNTTNIDDIENNSLFNIFYNEDVNLDFDEYVFTLNYDDITNVNLSIDDSTDKVKTRINNLKENKIYIYDIINYLNNDISNSFEEYLKIYNNNIYKSSIKEFASDILTKLYEHLCSNNNIKFLESETSNIPVLYVPLDYKFNYTVSNTDPLNIYYINDIFVKTSNIIESDYDEDGIKEILSINNLLLFDCYENVYEKVDLLNININYDKDLDDYVSGVIINDIYTMPFIGKNHKWYINNINSNIDARGKDAGSPTFLLVQTYKKSMIEENFVDVTLHNDLGDTVTIYNIPAQIGNNEERVITIGDDSNNKYTISINNENLLYISSNPQVSYLGNTNVTLRTKNVTSKSSVTVTISKYVEGDNNDIIIGSFTIECLPDDDNYDYKILNNSVTNYEYLNDNDATSPMIYDFKINKDYMSASEPLNCKIRLPRITSTNSQYFENIVLMVISSFNCINNADVTFINNNKDISLCTFWVLGTDSSNNTTLVPITLYNDDTVLDFSQFLANLAKSSSTSSNNDYSQLIVKAETGKVISDNYDYFSISSKTKNDINTEYDIDDEYSNNLTIRPEFFDTLSTTSGTPALSTTSGDYFIEDISEIGLTNSLYQTKEKTDNIISVEIKQKDIISYIQTNNLVVTTYDFININNILNGETQVTDQMAKTSELYAYISYITKTIDYEENNYEYTKTNYNEYEPNEDVPMIDLKEVVLKNSNILNRYNIISLCKDSNNKTIAYYSYIGTSSDNDNKDILHIGTSNTNINIGNNTLLDPSQNSEFTKHSTISIDFDNIYNNSYQVINNNESIIKTTINNTDYMTWTIDSLIGSTYTGDSLNIEIDSNNAYYITSNISTYIPDKDIIFRKYIINENTLNDGYAIYLNNLFKRINIDLNDYKNNISLMSTSYSEQLVRITKGEVSSDMYIFAKDPIIIDDTIMYDINKLTILYYIKNNNIKLLISWK